MKNIENRIIFFLLIALNAIIAGLEPITTNDPTKANGPDMETPNNPMFIHSQNIYPDDNPTLRYFQPYDKSLNNGRYDQATNQAETDLHSYINIIEFDATSQTPELNAQGKYIDEQGHELEIVGIFNEYSENMGEAHLYYLFGKISKIKNSSPNNNLQNNDQPTIDFNSYPAENDGYPRIENE